MMLVTVYALSLLKVLAEIAIYAAFIHMAFTLAPVNGVVMVASLAIMFGVGRLLNFLAQKHMEKLIKKTALSVDLGETSPDLGGHDV